MSLLAHADPIWNWQPHPEVWALVLGVIGLRLYAQLAIAPKALPPGSRAFSNRQNLAFGIGLALLWVASDWPLHDIAEERLYAAHMLQHFMLTMAVPPLLWLATPEWLARLVVSETGHGRQVLRWIAKPLVAMLVFNLPNLLGHWPDVVALSVGNGAFHLSAHLVLVTSAFVMWIPVVGPWKELRLTLPGQMVYLFAISIFPTLPAAWLAYSDTVVYTVYDHGPRLWGISALDDQVAAGMIMKLVEIVYLWAIISVKFFTWASRNLDADRRGVVEVDERALLDPTPTRPPQVPEPPQRVG